MRKQMFHPWYYNRVKEQDLEEYTIWNIFTKGMLCFMNYLWGGMILLGILYGACTGRLDQVTTAVTSSAGDAVNLCISMAGMTALWSGLMKISENSGMVEGLAVKMSPVLDFLFPELKQEKRARHCISMNFLANMLGLGWAATLQAMKELDTLQREKSGTGVKTASHAMCTFLILNVSSLQLIPVNLITYRAKYGSISPAAITGPALLATGISTAAAVIFCKIAGIISKNT